MEDNQLTSNISNSPILKQETIKKAPIVFDKEQHLKAKEELLQEIQTEIKHRKKYQSMDFSLAHLFLWLSILASFGSTIIIAAAVNIDKIIIAAIAGIPGLVILIEKSFDFTKRAVWGGMYSIELEELKDELQFGAIEPYDASKKLRRIKKRKEMLFSRIGFFNQKKTEEDEI